MTCIVYHGIYSRFLLPIGTCFPSEVSERLIRHAQELNVARALYERRMLFDIGLSALHERGFDPP